MSSLPSTVATTTIPPGPAADTAKGSPRRPSGPDGDSRDYTPQAEFSRATSSVFEPQRQPLPTDALDPAAPGGGGARSTRAATTAALPEVGTSPMGGGEAAKRGPIRHLWDRMQKVTDSSYLYPVLSLLIVCILTIIVVFAPGILLWYKFGSVLLSVIFAAFTYRHCRKRGGVVAPSH